MSFTRRLAKLESAAGGMTAPTDAEFAEAMRRSGIRSKPRLAEIFVEVFPDRRADAEGWLGQARAEVERLLPGDTREAAARDDAIVLAWYRAQGRLQQLALDPEKDDFLRLREPYVPPQMHTGSAP